VAVAGRVTQVLLNVRFGGKAPPNARPCCLGATLLPADTSEARPNGVLT
jgi:hypothetical protein